MTGFRGVSPAVVVVPWQGFFTRGLQTGDMVL